MANYIVRLKETKEIVGIFSATNLTMLADMIDEVTDPFDCEYSPIDDDGGIIWHRPKEAAVPIEGDDMPEDFFARAELTHFWGVAVFDTQAKWKSFKPEHNPYAYMVRPAPGALKQ